MAKFWKDALYPGSYRLPDGRRRNYTPTDVVHLARRVKDMVARGLQIPLCWEHQAEAKPRPESEQLADRARLNLGFVADARVSPEGFLEVLADVPVEDDAKRLPAVRFVSPELCTDWIDGDGRKWPGRSLTHLAVTSRPVQHRQGSFRPAAERLSHAGVERLSLTDYEGLSMDMNGTIELPKVLAALKSKGIILPEDTSEENLVHRLYVACVALGSEDSTDTGTTDTDTEDTTITGGGTDDVTEQTPTMMSMHAALKATQTRLLASERKTLERRVRDLMRHGKISQPVRDKLLNELKVERLSLDRDGNLKTGKLVAKIEAYEALDGSPFLAERMSLTGIREEVDESERRVPRSSEETKAVVDLWDEAMGRKK